MSRDDYGTVSSQGTKTVFHLFKYGIGVPFPNEAHKDWLRNDVARLLKAGATVEIQGQYSSDGSDPKWNGYLAMNRAREAGTYLADLPDVDPTAINSNFGPLAGADGSSFYQ